MLRRIAVPVLFTILLLSAATTASAGYSLVPWTDCGGGYNSGSYDDAGELFVPCGSSTSTLRVSGADGNLKTWTALPFYVQDAAPSPDGAYVYVSGADIVPRRLNREADGSYVLDATWAPAHYNLYADTEPHGLFIDTDSAGNIYLADGAWSPNMTHTVIKYAPNGSVITRFGEWSNTWNLGFFYWQLGGVDAVGDGSAVYTLEAGNDRVQKWVRQPNGSYTATASYGGSAATDPAREGACSNGAFAGTFSAPYDLGSDTAGNFYVINTTCHEVIKFDSDWNYIEDIDVGSEANPSDAWPDGSLKRPHGIAVAANGNVCIGQSHMRLQADGTPVPCNGSPTVPTGGGGGTQDPPPTNNPVDPGPNTDPPPIATPADTRAPRLTVAAAKRQHLGRARKVKLNFTCDETCTAAGRITLKIRKRSFTARARGNAGRVVLVIPRAAARALKRAGVLATATLTASDAAGNAATPVVRRIRVLP